MRSEGAFDLAAHEDEIGALETEASQADLWSDPTRAHEVMQRLSRLNEERARWNELDERLSTTTELLALVGPDDNALLDDLAHEVDAITRMVDEREVALMLSGPYDDRPAFLQVQAGAGGV